MTPHPGLPAELLDRTDLRAALTEHDFAAAFALIKKYGGLSQNQIGHACQLTPGKVSTILNGRQQVTSIDVIRRISDGLRIPGHLVGLAPRPWEEQPATPQPATPRETGPPADDHTWQPQDTVDLAAALTRTDLTMDRRRAAALIAAAAVTGAALLDPLEAWLGAAAEAPSGSRRPGRLGAQDVAQLELTARAFRQWGHQYGGGLRWKAVLGQLAEVSAALEEHQAPAVEVRLYRVMAQLAGTAAGMAWDTGRQRRAQDYYRLALRAAHAGRDRPYGANVLAGMARQMLYTGRAQDALELVRLAQDGARDEAGPRLRSMLHTREAWALAQLGRTAAFRRMTERAREALADAGPQHEEPHWIGYFDESELDGVTGGRLLDLARAEPSKHADEAAEHIQRAIDYRDPRAGRSIALDRIGLAETRYLVGDLEEAVRQTHAAAEVAERTDSGRVRAQLTDLYGYTVGRAASAPVREARDRLRGLLADD